LLSVDQDVRPGPPHLNADARGKGDPTPLAC
jgi:hypothetical protein